METTHTRGTWFTTGKPVPVLELGGLRHAAIYAYRPATDESELVALAVLKDKTSHPMESNAQLIAAAPELLEACKEAFSMCALITNGWAAGSKNTEIHRIASILEEAIRKAQVP